MNNLYIFIFEIMNLVQQLEEQKLCTAWPHLLETVGALVASNKCSQIERQTIKVLSAIVSLSDAQLICFLIQPKTGMKRRKNRSEPQ